MYDVVDASAQTRRLPAQIQDYFYYLTALFFSESYVRFMFCHVTLYTKNILQRLWRDCAYLQSRLSLHCELTYGVHV